MRPAGCIVIDICSLLFYRHNILVVTRNNRPAKKGVVLVPWYEFEGKGPQVGSQSFVHPEAVLIGDVTIGEKDRKSVV